VTVIYDESGDECNHPFKQLNDPLFATQPN